MKDEINISHLHDIEKGKNRNKETYLATKEFVSRRKLWELSDDGWQAYLEWVQLRKEKSLQVQVVAELSIAIVLKERFMFEAKDVAYWLAHGVEDVV